MTKSNAYNKLFKEINKQLENKGILVDASIVDTPLRPKGKTKHNITQDRQDEEEVSIEKDYPSSVDQEGVWLKQRGKYHFEYKKHYVTDEEGLVCGLVITKASVNEVSNLEEIFESADLPEGINVKADKGYQSEKNNEILKKKKLKNHLMKKAKKNKSLTS